MSIFCFLDPRSWLRPSLSPQTEIITPALTKHIASDKQLSQGGERQTDSKFNLLGSGRFYDQFTIICPKKHEPEWYSWQLWLDERIVYWLKILITSLMSSMSRTINKIESDTVGINFTRVWAGLSDEFCNFVIAWIINTWLVWMLMLVLTLSSLSGCIHNVYLPPSHKTITNIPTVN